MTMPPSNDEPRREFQLTVEKMKAGETTLLGPDDVVAQADWDDVGKWCLLTVLRRVR